MKTRIYLKQRKDGTQTMFVAHNTEIFDHERYFIGSQIMRNGRWGEWEMTEKDMNRMVKQGRMQRIQ